METDRHFYYIAHTTILVKFKTRLFLVAIVSSIKCKQGSQFGLWFIAWV